MGIIYDVISETNLHYFIDGNSLLILSADLADSATYECRAVNDVGQDIKEFVVFVQSTECQYNHNITTEAKLYC